MTKIEEFLQRFDDQHLANLQCAAEDGRLKYRDGCNCLLHHFAGEYSVTKWDPELGPLARAAEGEFYRSGAPESEPVLMLPDISLSHLPAIGDSRRRALILPLIYAEWGRRLRQVLGEALEEPKSVVYAETT